MNLTLPGLNDVWKESEEFRPLKFPKLWLLPLFFFFGAVGLLIHKACLHRTVTNKHINTDKRWKKNTKLLLWTKRTQSDPSTNTSMEAHMPERQLDAQTEHCVFAYCPMFLI